MNLFAVYALWTAAAVTGASDDRGNSRDRPAGDQSVDLVRALVGIDGFGVREDFGHLEVRHDSVAAEEEMPAEA